MIRQLESEDSTERELILQIITNLSGEDAFQKIFLELNTIYRICSLTLRKVDEEIKEQDTDLFDIYDVKSLNKEKNQLEVKYGKLFCLIF